MKKIIDSPVKTETYSLAADITYAHVPYWYGETQRALKLSILMPKHKENHKMLPLLVWLCGGAFRVMDRNVWIPQLNELARSGFVIASVEYRTSHEAPFPAALIDVKAAIRYLRAHAKQYCIDADDISVMGESAGATLACLTGVTGDMHEFEKGDFSEFSSRVNRVIDFYGISDMLHEPVDKSGENARVIEDFVNDDFEVTAPKASAVNYIDKDARLPYFLIFHGNKDKLVPIEQSEKLYEKLIDTGHRADFYVVEGAEHGADEFYQEEIISIIKEKTLTSGK